MESAMPLMSSDPLDHMKSLIGFNHEDGERLSRLRPLFEEHGPAIIDRLHHWLRNL
jgi:hypothetical protein